MAHPQQISYVKTIAQHLSKDFTGVKVLEIGSYNVNGSIRECFPGSTYTGVDLTEGPGVDLVADGHAIDHPADSYDIALSCECFEHNPYWLETFLNMYRMAKPGGFVVFTCATRGRLEHGTRRTSPKASPGTQDVGWDYYLNLEAKDFEKRIVFDELFSSYVFIVNKKSRDLYFVGKKNGDSIVLKFDKNVFLKSYFADQKSLESDLKKRRSLLGTIFWSLYVLSQIPLNALNFLPDRIFQKFAITYHKTLLCLLGPFGKLVKKKINPESVV
mgnify:CR=1 FL=1